MQYTVYIVTPSNYQHSAAFTDVALSLNESLTALGHESTIITDPQEAKGKTITLGANLATTLPKDFIIWNLEQIFPANPWLTPSYVNILKNADEVWDYSLSNISELSKLGITAKLCGIGYSSCLITMDSSAALDIDVLHVGSLSERRRNILNELVRNGVKVHCLFGTYGKERDDWIARSKIVINIHFYESSRFEIVRCSHLMSNRKCIISETSDGGELYNEGICFTDYNNIVPSCISLLGDDAKRLELADKGFEIFSKQLQTDYLRELL